MTLTALFKHRLLRLCASGHHDSIEILVKVTKYKILYLCPTYFSTGYVNCVENDDTKTEPLTNIKLSARHALLSGRRRPLSPLERISSLLPQDSLTPEVEELREQGQLLHERSIDVQYKHQPFDNTVAHSTEEDNEYSGVHKGNDNKEDGNSTNDASLVVDTTDTHISECLYEKQPCLKGETLLSFGEMLVAEYRKGRQVEFRKMFQLQTGTRLQSSWGIIPHDDIAGRPAGSFIKTSRGAPILIRRASLEDYVLFMKRGPAIAYPKDAASMLVMMDVTNGDCVLEAGSGSGAMSLFLSRAVGASGKVLSVEVREDHQKRAVLNYNRWRASWELRRGEEWPDNVEFVQADLCTASVLDGWGFNAVALDLIHPHLVLATVFPHLHPGGVCAVYLANITQVIDLLEGLRCLRMPLLCERIIELPARDWIVAPALQKDGSYCLRKSPTMEDDVENQEASHEDKKEEGPAFGSIPYIARPHPQQMSHTAFLVKLRKYVR